MNRFVRALALAALVLVTAAGLHVLALQAARNEIGATSACVDAPAALARSQWPMASQHELVGAEVKGAAGVLEGGLLSAEPGDAYAFISLNLHGRRIDADVSRHLRIDAPRKPQSSLVLFAALAEDGTVIQSEPIDWPSDDAPLSVDLMKLAWTDADGRVSAWAGRITALRLHPSFGTASAWQIDDIRIEADRNVLPMGLDQLPLRQAQPSSLIAGSIDAQIRDAPSLAVWSLDQERSAESLLALRDRILRDRPASLVTLSGVPDVECESTEDDPSRVTAAAWTMLAAIACWALVRRRARTPAPRAVVDLLVGLGPLGYALSSGAIGDQISAWMIAALAAGLGLLVLAAYQESSARIAQRRRPSTTTRSLVWLAVPAVLALAIAGSTMLAAPATTPAPWLSIDLLRYLIWVGVQQGLLAAALLPLCLRLCADRPLPARLLCALLFALAHYPNGALMLGCWLGALCWLRALELGAPLWQRVLSHWLAASILVTLTPDWLVRSAEVGARFFMPG